MRIPRTLALAALLSLVGCQADESAIDSDDPVAGAAALLAQLPVDVKASLSALPRASVVLLTPRGMPETIQGDLGSAIVPVGDVVEAQRSLAANIETIAPVFRARPENLELRQLSEDEDGGIHADYYQTRNGIEVLFSDVRVHLNGDGMIYSVTAAVGEETDGDVDDGIPSLDEAAAIESARRDADPAGSYSFDSPRLVYIRGPYDDTVRLAWAVRKSGTMSDGTPALEETFVDAHSGEVLHHASLISFAKYRQIKGTGNTSCTPPGTAFVPAYVEGKVLPTSDNDADSQYTLLGNAWDYYYNVHARDSWFAAAAGNKIKGVVHCNTTKMLAMYFYSNVADTSLRPCLEPCGMYVVQGDGDGWVYTSPITGPYNALAANQANDVIGHEFTHAVFRSEVTPAVSPYYELGAIDEGFADIMGAAIERWKIYGNLVDTTTADIFRGGEDIFTPTIPGDAVRDMDQPSDDCATYCPYGNICPGGTANPVGKSSTCCVCSRNNYTVRFVLPTGEIPLPGATPTGNDMGWVHFNNGIITHAFHHLSQGCATCSPVVTAKGFRAAAKIFYRAMRDYMVSTDTWTTIRARLIYAAEKEGGELIPNGVCATTNYLCIETADALTSVAIP
ncbi:MAG: M4 family metallopeptidase [Pseudomonadota bacterium]